MTERGRILRATGRLVVASAAVFAALVPAGSAFATTSVTSGTLTCSVTALPPTLIGTTLTGWATVKCNKVTSVQLLIGDVELDGNVEDTKVPIPTQSKGVDIKASQVNTLVLVSTGSVRCVDTETGKEEYASKAMLSLYGPTSSWDRFATPNDSYSC